MVLGLLVVVLTLVIPHKTAPASWQDVALRFKLMPLTLVGGWSLARTCRVGYWTALSAFAVRLVFDSIDISIHHKDRSLPAIWTFDVVMLVYLVLRIRSARVSA